LVGQYDTREYGQNGRGNPPTDRVAEEVDLLSGLVFGPETYTTKEEGPLDRLRRVRVARSQSVVVEEHGALKLEVLLQERHRLDFALVLLEAWRIHRKARNFLNIPDVRGLSDVLVTVDLSLLVCPVRKGCRVGPHSNLGGEVNEFEVGGHSLELLLVLAVLDPNLEQSVVETAAVRIFSDHSSEFLVGGVERRGDIVSKKPAVGYQMAESDNIAVLDRVTKTFHLDRGDDLPQVVGVVVRVAGNLLTLRRDTAIIITQRVLVNMRMKVDLGLLVLHRDVVEVIDANRLLGHQVVAKSLLELGCHEIVTRTRSGENGEVDLEPEEVHQERNDDKADDASSQVLSEFRNGQRTLLAVDVEQIPEIDDYRHTNREEGEGANILRADNTRHANAGQQKPFPPLSTERRMSELVESDVAKHTQCHEENQSGIQQDKTCLSDVRVVKEDEGSRDDTSRKAVAGLPHDQEDHADRQRSHHGGHRSVGDVWNLVGDVRVANVLKEERSIVSNQPASECEQELAKGRVHVEEVSALKVVGREL
jgi:hypothetical protein